jgi:predicted transcriptional regulator
MMQRKKSCRMKKSGKNSKTTRPNIKLIEEIITAGQEKNLTQKDLAEPVGTRQSNISRLESGNYNPTLDFLN